MRTFRLQRLQQFMREHEYDALLFTGADWFEWLSNHSLSDQSFERPFLVAVTGNGDVRAVMSELSRNSIAAHQQRGQSWVRSYAHYAESPDASKHRWNATQVRELVADSLTIAGLAQARVAVDALSAWLADALALRPQMRVCKAGEALQSLRWVKHADELATMQVCAELTDWAIDRYREELRPGRLTAEVDYLVSAKLVAEAARRLPGENFVIKGLRTLSGAVSACSDGDGTPNGKILEANALATTGLGTRLNGLAMEVGRPWLVGSPDKSIVELFECARSAQEAAIEAVVAGRPVSGMQVAAQAVLDRAGLGSHLRIRAGHGIGVVQHDFPVDVPFNQRSLLEHEVYAVEPSLYIAGVGGFRFADTVAVGAAAPERMTRAPKNNAALTLN